MYYFMALCPICRIKQADKKNSHLIPWFMIKKTITEKGTGERLKVLSFSIHSDQLTKVFIGQGILPETIEEFGQLHVAQNEAQDPYSRDYLICSECETKLSRLEAIFASRFPDKKVTNVNTQDYKDINIKVILTDANYNRNLYELLIQSVFYRCSIGKFNGFCLEKRVEEKIEQNLRLAFSTPSLSKLNPTTNIDFPYSFPIITTLIDMGGITDTTATYITTNQSRFPYFIMAGKWLFQMYEKEKQVKSSSERLFSLTNMFNQATMYKNLKNSAHVIVLQNSAGRAILDNVVSYFLERKIRGIKKNIRILHHHFFKKKPKEQIVEYLYQRYVFHSDKNNELDYYAHAFNDLKLLPDRFTY